MKVDPHAVKDALLEGAVSEQRTKGIMPTPEVAESYFEGILNRLDRVEKKPQVGKTETKENKVENEANRRAERAGFSIEGSWELENRPLAAGGDQLVVTKEAPLAKLLRHRIRLLRNRRDWRAKLERINPFALQGRLGEEKQLHATELVRQIVKDSNVIFGDWWKAKPKKLWSYKGQTKRS